MHSDSLKHGKEGKALRTLRRDRPLKNCFDRLYKTVMSEHNEAHQAIGTRIDQALTDH